MVKIRDRIFGWFDARNAGLVLDTATTPYDFSLVVAKGYVSRYWRRVWLLVRSEMDQRLGLDTVRLWYAKLCYFDVVLSGVPTLSRQKESQICKLDVD